MEHTKGPWRIFPQSLQVGGCTLGLQIWAGDVRIAFTEQQNVGVEQEKRNADVLAAAPEMLATLKSMRNTLIRLGGDPMPTLDAVIAKAEGR